MPESQHPAPPPGLKFKIVPAPESLKEEVEYFRLIEYSGQDELALHVSLNGLPGLAFQHTPDGGSAIKNIVTLSGQTVNGQLPSLFLYGQNSERSVMHQSRGPFAMTQVMLKPHALKTLLGLDAAELTHQLVDLREFSSGELNDQLFEASGEQARLDLLTGFLLARQRRVKSGDELVREGLSYLHRNIHSVNVRSLIEHLGISQRQFERRFTQSVGLSPQFYIRIRRFMEALKLMKSGKFERLTDVAQALNYYDQSHFIRDVREFSGVSPKDISQRVDDFHAQGGYFQLKT